MIERYSTTNLALAAALLAYGFPMVHHEPVETGRRSYFFFEDGEQLQAAIQLFYRLEMAVEPEAYFNALKSIKSRIYE